jgi:hypothetical protein
MDYTVAMMPSATRTRVLVSQGPDELLRAVLPPPASVHHEQAAIRLLEGLALWLSAKLHVVLCVDDKDAAFCLGLTDELGIGARSIYFDVEVRSPRGRRRRRGQRVGGIGDFTDLRQLWLLRLIPDGN